MSSRASHCVFQVCFKHPDLLKQAREACVIKREETNRLKRKNTVVTNSSEPKTKVTKESTETKPKMCKIQFQDDDSEELSENEEYAEILPSCHSRDMPMTSTAQNSVKIRFRLAAEDSEDSDKELEMEDAEDLEQQLNDIFGDSTDSSNQSSAELKPNHSIKIQKSDNNPSRKVMKIHYQDYYRRILESEMKSLMHQSYLNDVQFVCSDGVVTSNSLILGSMSPYLYNILADVPIVDRLKTVIIPDVSSVDLNVLFKLLFSQQTSVSIKDMKRVKSLAQLFRLEPILVLTRKPGRPKGSQNKPKKSMAETRIVQAIEEQEEVIEDENSDDDHEHVENEEDLEIFKSAPEMISENNDSRREDHNQSTLNLLPNNDILDQIVQETGS